MRDPSKPRRAFKGVTRIRDAQYRVYRVRVGDETSWEALRDGVLVAKHSQWRLLQAALERLA